MLRKTRKQKRKLQRNFYTEINKQWQDATQLPDTETRITLAYFIQKDINKELDTIIRAQKGPMADLIASWQANENKIPDGITALTNTMFSMQTITDIASRIGWMNRYGFPAPLAIYIQGDPRNHERCRVFIEEGQPRIGIPEYWLWPEYLHHRKAYEVYVKRLATTLGLPSILQGYECERGFAKVFPIATERRRRIDMKTFSELSQEFQYIDWTAMLTAWGLRKDQLADIEYNITSFPFLHHLQVRIHKWSMDRWRGWFGLIMAQSVAGCSPPGPLREAWFDYSRRFMQGTKKDETPQELRHAIARIMMPNSLGRLWVDKHCDADLKSAITKMMNHIRDAAALQLRMTTWMSESTRKAAVRKLKRMDVQICWPDLNTWKVQEVGCGLSSTNLIENIMAIGKLNTDINQEMMVGGNCRHPYGESWGKPVYEVNAYYYPDENRFLLPAAILRAPFYDAKRPIAWNYGAIGATIGHEFCHAFDSDGREYDENGDKRDWWTERDAREYKLLARRVIRLYETEQYREHDVDGTLTLVENIADIGGIGFALVGLKLALRRPPRKEELRDFFTSFAVSWRSKDRIKRAAELLATDSHSPPMLRVNHVVRQMDDWYLAFDVGPGDKNWTPPEERIRFFGAKSL